MICPADCSCRGECEHGFCWCAHACGDRHPLLLPFGRPLFPLTALKIGGFGIFRRCQEGFYGNDCGHITAAKWAALTGDGGKGKPLPAGARAAQPRPPAATAWPEGVSSGKSLTVVSEEVAASGAGGGLKGEAPAKGRRRPLIYIYELPKQFNIQVCGGDAHV